MICIYCGVQTTGSIGGDVICPACDCGMTVEVVDDAYVTRKWLPHDIQYKRLMGFEPLAKQEGEA